MVGESRLRNGISIHVTTQSITEQNKASEEVPKIFN